ncbi:MAG: conjugal transfer protein TraI [Agriterribacter sp.]
MKKIVLMATLSVGLAVMPTQKSHAIVWEIIRQALIAAIRAADLAVQRLQNKTIWLQSAQKSLENVLSKAKLNEISDWMDKHRKQYAVYFEELKKVKAVIIGYKKVKGIINDQLSIVNEYKRAFSLFKKDKHFTDQELTYMAEVYEGIVGESLKNINQLSLVTESMATEMNDGKRLEIINNISERISQVLTDLRKFNRSNIFLSFHRSKDERELTNLKVLYNINE